MENVTVKYTKQGVRDLDAMYPSKKRYRFVTVPQQNCDHRRMRKAPACEYCASRGLKWCGTYECPCGFYFMSWEPDAMSGYKK